MVRPRTRIVALEKKTPMRILIFATAVLFGPLVAFGQTSDAPAANGNPRITVVAGLGNATGILPVRRQNAT